MPKTTLSELNDKLDPYTLFGDSVDNEYVDLETNIMHPYRTPIPEKNQAFYLDKDKWEFAHLATQDGYVIKKVSDKSPILVGGSKMGSCITVLAIAEDNNGQLINVGAAHLDGTIRDQKLKSEYFRSLDNFLKNVSKNGSYHITYCLVGGNSNKELEEKLIKYFEEHESYTSTLGFSYVDQRSIRHVTNFCVEVEKDGNLTFSRIPAEAVFTKSTALDYLVPVTNSTALVPLLDETQAPTRKSNLGGAPIIYSKDTDQEKENKTKQEETNIESHKKDNFFGIND